MHVSVGGCEFELSETLTSDALAPIFDDAWTASRVWTASCFLSEHLVAMVAEEKLSLTSSSVIELGSGCGLVGIVTKALLGAKSVVLTDQREAIELLQRNVAKNIPLAFRQEVSVYEYRWGTSAAAANLPMNTFDYIFISDCINPIYGTESWRNLGRSIRLLSHASTITYLSHEARGEDEAMIDFLSFTSDFLVCERFVHDSNFRSDTMTEKNVVESGSFSDVFWGDNRKPASAASPKNSVRFRQRLPDLHHSASAQLILCEQTNRDSVATRISQPVASIEHKPHDSMLSLLRVLQTLWRSIARDTDLFTEHTIKRNSMPPIADKKYLKTNYYTPGAFKEDPAYFLEEKEAELHKEITQAKTKQIRQLHCALEDEQFYPFDRNTPNQQEKKCRNNYKKKNQTKSFTIVSEKQREEHTNVENALIARHDHKIRHLLHVLQEEMANETKREIRALHCYKPGRPMSRQGKRRFADLIKERYEAADRIMRLLEEHHVIVGVDATEYLLYAIEQSRLLGR